MEVLLESGNECHTVADACWNLIAHALLHHARVTSVEQCKITFNRIMFKYFSWDSSLGKSKIYRRKYSHLLALMCCLAWCCHTWGCLSCHPVHLTAPQQYQRSLHSCLTSCFARAVHSEKQIFSLCCCTFNTSHTFFYCQYECCPAASDEKGQVLPI